MMKITTCYRFAKFMFVSFFYNCPPLAPPRRGIVARFEFGGLVFGIGVFVLSSLSLIFYYSFRLPSVFPSSEGLGVGLLSAPHSWIHCSISLNTISISFFSKSSKWGNRIFSDSSRFCRYSCSYCELL